MKSDRFMAFLVSDCNNWIQGFHSDIINYKITNLKKAILACFKTDNFQ